MRELPDDAELGVACDCLKDRGLDGMAELLEDLVRLEYLVREGRATSWIGVGDRLPGLYKDVLTFRPEYGGRTEIASLSVPEAGIWMDDQANPIRPTHWMPLPDHPKATEFPPDA